MEEIVGAFFGTALVQNFRKARKGAPDSRGWSSKAKPETPKATRALDDLHRKG